MKSSAGACSLGDGQRVSAPSLGPKRRARTARLGFLALIDDRPQTDGMSDHKFRVGQNVYCALPFNGSPRTVYKIVQLLPADSDEFQYRVKSADEPHERVVKERQLSPAWDSTR